MSGDMQRVTSGSGQTRRGAPAPPQSERDARAPHPDTLTIDGAPGIAATAAIGRLQQTVGNAEVARLMRTVHLQRQPRTGAPDAPGTTDLKVGSRGPAVMDVQQKLNALGAHPRLAVDGKFGPLTRGGVVRFQKAHASDGLSPTGVVDSATRGVLGTVREIDANEHELGKRIAEDARLANAHKSADSGIFYAEEYRRKFGSTPRGRSLSADDYRLGYADPTYFDRLGFMQWRLKSRVSASEGIRSFMRGLTIAECNTVAGATYMDAVRAAIGDHRFDERYGSAAHDVAENRRLVIGVWTPPQTPSVAAMAAKTDFQSRPGAPGTIGHRPVKVGEWFYFKNHPQYPSKHPGGSWQGENAIYLGVHGGQEKWSGFGADDVTERYMLNKLVQFYNRPAPSWRGTPQRITIDSLIADGGGFQVTSGMHLDVSKVKALQ